MLGYHQPQNDKKYEWTNHVVGKMFFYRLSESQVKRVMRSPKRVEKGIAEGTIAMMQPAQTAKKTEIWVMYQELKGGRKRVITAWRYPGESPKRDVLPIPDEIMLELRKENLI